MAVTRRQGSESPHERCHFLADWDLESSWNQRAFGTSMTSQYDEIPAVFSLITTMLYLKTHSISLHNTRWDKHTHRDTHTNSYTVCTEASWKNTAVNDPTQKPEGGTLFKVHRKDDAILHYIERSYVQLLCSALTIHFGNGGSNVLFIERLQRSHREDPHDLMLPKAALSKVTVRLQRDQPNSSYLPLKYVHRLFCSA